MCEIDSWGQLKNKFLGHPSSLLIRYVSTLCLGQFATPLIKLKTYTFHVRVGARFTSIHLKKYFFFIIFIEIISEV
jgi:hypothetical protein